MRKFFNPLLFAIALTIIFSEILLVKFRSYLPFNVAYIIVIVNFFYFNLIFFPDVRRRYKAHKTQPK